MKVVILLFVVIVVIVTYSNYTLRNAWDAENAWRDVKRISIRGIGVKRYAHVVIHDKDSIEYIGRVLRHEYAPANESQSRLGSQVGHVRIIIKSSWLRHSSRRYTILSNPLWLAGDHETEPIQYFRFDMELMPDTLRLPFHEFVEQLKGTSGVQGVGPSITNSMAITDEPRQE